MAAAIRVLYVDDESTLLELGKMFLERAGDITVTTATSAPDAIRLLERESFDTIVSDYQMPEMDGVEFLVLVRTKFGQIPFILFTGKGREEVVIKALNAGVDGYLQKGGDPSAQFAELSHKIKQATSRKKAEEALQESEEKYQVIVDHALEAIMVIDSSANVLFANPAAATLVDIEDSSACIGKNALEIIAPESREVARADFASSWEGRDGYIAQYKIITATARERWVELIGKKISFGGVSAVIVMFRDITERKRAEEALNESEKRFRELSDLLPQTVYETDVNGILTYANRIAFKWFGYTEEEFRQGLNVLQMIAPHDRERAGAAFRAIIEGTGRKGVSEEYRALKKEGSTFPISIYSSVVIVQGRITGLRGIIIDNTERKRAEKALVESEERYHLLAEHMTDIVWLMDMDIKTTYQSPSSEKLRGYTSQEIKDLPLEKNLTPESLKLALEVFLVEMPRIEGDPNYNPVKILELEYYRKDGTTFWSESKFSIIRDGSGKPVSILGEGRDITERKKADLLLCESEEKFRTLIQNINDGVMVHELHADGAGKIVEVNDRFCEITGYTRDELLQLSVTDLDTPERQVQIPETMRQLADKKHAIFETEHRTPDGRRVPIEVSVSLFDLQGKPVGLSTVRDITERKRAEDCTHTTLQRLNTLCSRLYAGVLTVSEDGTVEHANQAFCDLFNLPDTPVSLCGLASSEIMKKIQDAFNSPARILARIKEITDQGKPIKGDEISMPDGRVVMVDYIPIIDGEGQRRGRIWHLQDITARKRAEQELRESENRYRTLAESSTDTIFIIGRDDTIRFVNAHAAGNLHLPADKIIGKPRKNFFHLDIADTQGMYLQEVFETGEPFREEGKIMFGNQEFWQDTSLVPLKDETGNITAVLGVSRDITERKRAEEALRESEELFKSVVHNSSDLTILADAKGIVTFVSPQCENVLGYPGDKFIGQIMPDIIYPDDVTGCRHAWEQVVQHGQEQRDFEYRIVDGEGAVRWISHSAKRATVDGKVLGIQSDIRDITGWKQAADTIALTSRKLALINDVTYQYIQNKVTGLRGYAEVSKYAKTEAERVSLIEKEKQILADIHHLIKNTQEYQEIGLLQPRWIPVEQSIRIAVSLVSPKQGILVETALHGLELYFDPIIKKIFAKLIDNAVKHGKTVTRITVSCHETPYGLTLICEDDGVGISAEVKTRLFDRLFGENIHFGLFFIRECFDIFGMTIAETGKPGKGARFEITVPKGMWRMKEVNP